MPACPLPGRAGHVWLQAEGERNQVRVHIAGELDCRREPMLRSVGTPVGKDRSERHLPLRPVFAWLHHSVAEHAQH